MNYYPFHIGDYLSATRHLSWVEDMAYRRLLDTYYTTEKPLPADLRACCRLVLATTDEQREAVQIVLEEFFELTADGWINARADKEIDAMREKQQKQRDRANKRWQKPDAEPGNASAMPRHEGSDATASKKDANAMPPTPTPTPTPTPIKEEERAQRTRSAPTSSISKPDDVDQQTWADWIALRKAKRAPVTETVVSGARTEARKAGMTLDAFLRIWCTRGSQGLQAEWLRPDELGGRGGSREPVTDWTAQALADERRRAQTETAHARKMRETVEGLAPSVARKTVNTPLTIDMEAPNAAAIERR